MKTWGTVTWVFVIILFSLIALIVYVLSKFYHELGILWFYLLYIKIVVLITLWNTHRVKSQNRAIHIHHYCIGFMMMSLISVQNVLFALIHGFFNGMFIEGGANYGFDAIWPTLDDDGSEEMFFDFPWHPFLVKDKSARHFRQYESMSYNAKLIRKSNYLTR